MASGKNHDRGILLASPIWLVVGAHYAGLEMGIILSASHFLGGYWLFADVSKFC